MCNVLFLFNSTLWPQVLRVGAADITDACRAVMHRIRDRYRPELHYMRGPGPKFREKQLVATTSTNDSGTPE